MNRRIAMPILMMILVLQPFVILASLPMGAHLSPVDTLMVAQEPGSRLDADEYTNHVPILINGTQDFIDQHWPGSGTVNDPYLIEGLYIEYAMTYPLVQIIETDAYFIIRDCYVNQEEPGFDGVFFRNTTHGRVEYSDLYADGISLLLSNANNTVLSHSYLVSVFSTTCYAYQSHDCIMDSNYIESIFAHALYLWESHDTTSSDNTLVVGSSGSNAYYLVNSNNTVSTGDSASGNTAAFAAVNSHSTSLTGFTGVNVDLGIGLMDCPGSSITGSTFVADTDNAAEIGGSSGLTIEDSSFTSNSGHGILLAGCNDSVIIGCDIDDVALDGIDISVSDRVSVTDSMISDTGGSGIIVSNSLEVEIADNEIRNVGLHGIYLTSGADNGTIMRNVIDEVPLSYGAVYLVDSDFLVIDSNTLTNLHYHGIHASNSHGCEAAGNTIQGDYFASANALFSCENWTITDGYFNQMYQGAYVEFSHNLVYSRNHGEDITRSLLWAMNTDDMYVSENHASECDDYGYYLNAGWRNVYENNIAEYCPTGLYLYSSNTTVSGNQFQHLVDYGIEMYGAVNPIVSGNQFQHIEDYGIEIYSAVNPIVSENTFDTMEVGIFVTQTTGASFSDNELISCGFSYDVEQTLGAGHYDHTFSGNTVNGLPFYYATHTDSLNIDGSLYGEIILANCSYGSITGGSFTRSTSAVQLHYCDEFDISGVVAEDQEMAFLLESSDNGTLTDSQVSGGVGQYAMEVKDSTGFTMENTNFTGTSSVYLSTAYNYTINDCDFYDTWPYGIDSYQSWYGWIGGCVFSNISQYAIRLSNSRYAWIQYNWMQWVGIGIIAADLTSSYGTAFANTIQDSDTAIRLWSADYWTVTNNTFLFNEYGVEVWNSQNTDIHYNEFIGNTIGNAINDIAPPSNWDDGVDTGNWWSDYTPPGTYSIPGSAGGVDNYPMAYLVTEPIISHLQDFSYAEFSTGNLLTWHPLDDNLRDWEVEVDGEFWAADAWNYVEITVNFDGLSYGSHMIHITVWDLNDNYVTDTVWVTVYDDTPPIIDSPSDMIAWEGGSGQEIIWTVFDHHPGAFRVYEDGVLVDSGTWTSGTIAVNVDGLSEGAYIYTLVILDLDGNSEGDSVDITVLVDDVDPIISSPEDMEFIHGTSGHSILWQTIEDNPSHFEIVENNTVVASGVWGGAAVALDLDYLTPGYYMFTLHVFDLSGNTASDAVNVTVIPAEGWPPTTPLIDAGLIVVIAVIGGAIVAVVVIFFYRKRKTAE